MSTAMRFAAPAQLHAGRLPEGIALEMIATHARQPDEIGGNASRPRPRAQRRCTRSPGAGAFTRVDHQKARSHPAPEEAARCAGQPSSRAAARTVAGTLTPSSRRQRSPARTWPDRISTCGANLSFQALIRFLVLRILNEFDPIPSDGNAWACHGSRCGRRSRSAGPGTAWPMGGRSCPLG
jgi:hypothetical protein